MVISRKAKFSGKHKGQTLVEFALVLLFLLPIIFGLLEVGRLIFIYSTVVSAAREAARYGSAVGENDLGTSERYKDCAGIEAAAQRVDFLDAITNVQISYDHGPGMGILSETCPPPSLIPIENGDRITVIVTGVFAPVVRLPYAELNNITMTSRSSRSIMVKVDLWPSSP